MFLRTLYISYDGLSEPLGRSQVFSYLQGLSHRGATCVLISFEKPDDLNNIALQKTLRQEVREAGIHWIALQYHKTPTSLATLYDVCQGVCQGIKLIRRFKLRTVHARGYVSALMGYMLKRLLKIHFIFDMRNFWADEKVDAGSWKPNSLLYRMAKRSERAFLSTADRVVVLTERAREEVENFSYLQERVPPISIIPTCVDLELFTPRSNGFPPFPPVLVYAGSLGGRYLTDLLFSFVAVLQRRKPDLQFLLLTRMPVEIVEEARIRVGVSKESVRVFSATRKEVASYFQECHAGLSFLSDAYSNRSSAPTKLAEYLASGLPLVVTPGVGDTDSMIEQERVGVIVTESTLEEAGEKLLQLWEDPELSTRCRKMAEKHFSLESALDQYELIWRSLS